MARSSRLSSLLAVLLFVAAGPLGCSSQAVPGDGTAATNDAGSTGDGGTGDGATNGDAAAKSVCQALISCVAVASPESVGGLVQLYGDASPCWKGSATDADACGKACTKAAAAFPQCQASADPLACGGTLPGPKPPGQLDLTLRYQSFATGQPPAEVAFSLCNGVDPRCVSPLATVVDKAKGIVSAKVDYEFDGYFGMTPGSAFVPTYHFTSQPLRASTALEQTLVRLTELNFVIDTAVNMRNFYESAEHGVVFINARDCNRKPLGGVGLTTTAVDPLQRLLVRNSDGTLSVASSAVGELGAVYVNVPTGLHTFTAEFAATKKRLGSTRILVRAGAVSWVDILPSP